MAEAFNLRPFGYNVMPQGRQAPRESAGRVIEKAMDTLWEPVLNFLEKNEDVFDGSVAKEINKANIHTMRLGMALNGSAPTRSLDTKM